MADIDLFRDAYRTNLGREASDEELQGWVSGQYGGGSVQDRLNQIANSHEAQQRRPQVPTIPQNPIQVPDGWQPGQNPNVSRPMDTAPGGVDANFGSGVGDAYQQYLGRSASQDEIANWWSGTYGHGQGWSGYNSILEAIRNSPEARARNNGQAPNATRQSLEYWQGQGVNHGDIFDLTTGQIRPGWERYEGGYRRAGGAGNASSVPGPQGGNYQSWFTDLTRGKRVSPRTLKELEPILNQHGIKLGPPNARGWSDTIILPDGTVIDAIIAATEDGGQQWSWFTPTAGAGGVGGGPLPGNQFSDQYTQLLESLIKSRIGNLQGGYDDAARRQYESALQQRAAALGQGNQQLDQLLKYLQERFTNLQGPGYTGAENEVIRTGALDPIEQDRTAARQRMAEQLAARGHRPGSGVFEDAMRRVDAQFDSIRGVTQTQLTTNDLARREDRAQRAEMIGGQIADIPDARAREQLDVFSALERLSQVARQEDEARSREAISYGGVLSDLGPQRLQLAMQAAGMGGNPASLGGMLTNIAGMNQNAAAFNAQNSNSLWSGLGTLAAIMARSGQSGASSFGY